MSDLSTIIGEQFEHPAGPGCNICADVERAAAAVEAMGYRKPRTITTAEELDALPVGSVILDPLGEAYQRIHNGDGPALWSAGDVVSTRLIILAATVLHEGDKP